MNNETTERLLTLLDSMERKNAAIMELCKVTMERVDLLKGRVDTIEQVLIAAAKQKTEMDG